ncbi:DUF1740-domain-containing protein [Rhizodiscina lignyota]|uniref:DUF1740-domain-containing protein n=1 Tax=Rhizodiscina lignyota TaxID=1504668 RepID=A0A9P4IPI9_9PEZI|nr:DUF1740-domain-containing protein [Rhizodiscina lignyota]
MSQPSKPVIPKFASFPGKRPPPEPPKATETPEQRRTSPGRDKHRHRHKSHRHPTEDPNTRPRKRIRSESPARSEQKKYVTKRSNESSQSSLFVVDLKGDPQNEQFGRLHRAVIPQYRLVGYGRVLGLDNSWRIDRDASSESYITVSTSNRTRDLDPRLLSSKTWKNYKSDRLIIPKAGDIGFDVDDDFLPLRRRHHSRPAEAAEAVSDPLREVFDGRASRDDIRSHEQPLDSDSDSDIQKGTQNFEAEAAAGIEQADSEAKSRNALLSSLTTAEPNNVQAWLDFIHHQEEMMMLGRSRNSRGTSLKSSERHALADIRSNIYEKALRACKSNRHSRIRLLVSQMDEIADLWEGDKLSKRWKDLLRKEPDAAELWIKYLDFIQADFTHFRYDSCRKAFLECLKVLSANINQVDPQEAQPLEYLMETFAHVLARMSVMMHRAGYREHALALWQAILEFGFFRPKALVNASLEKHVQAFEEFWDSEVARIGEPDARGWVYFYERGGDPPAEQPQIEAENPGTKDGFADFWENEDHNSRILSHPGRALDKLGETDPYHTVLFSDVRPVLNIVPKTLEPAIILQAYLCFLGLPLCTGCPTLTAKLSLDPFLQRNLLRIPGSPSTAERPFLSASSYLQSTETLFSIAFDDWDITDNADWAVRSIESLVTAMAISVSDCVMEYLVSLVDTREHKLPVQSDHDYGSTTTNVSRVLQEITPSSPRIHNAGAIIESRSGHSHSRDNAFASALAWCSSLPEDRQADVVLLWRTWIWECLRTEDVQMARSRMLLVGGKNPNSNDDTMKDSPAARLKARQGFEKLRDLALSKGQAENAVLAIECLALLGYFAASNKNELAPALAVYKRAETLIEEHGLQKSSAHEYLHQARTQLLAYHIKHNRSYKPAVIRDALLESISLFPSNTIFLNLYSSSKSQFSVEDRIRGVAEDVLRTKAGSQSESIITQASAIADEMQRSVSSSGTVHAVHAAFERAVESKLGRNCQPLWEAYLAFELSQGKMDSEGIKKLFYRGLTHLPWSKSFMLRAFGDLKSCFRESELRRIYEVMEEKELRLHCDLNDFV